MRYLPFLLLALPMALPAQEPAPSLRTTSSEVLLDFVVRDQNARIIHDIRPGEVRVFEDGVQQKLRHFQFYDGRKVGVEPTSPNAPGDATAASADFAVQNAPHTVNELRDISVVSVVIANLDPRGRQLTVDAMRDFLKNELGPKTYIGVFSLGISGIRFVQPYTNDREKISAAVEKVANAAILGQITAPNQYSLPDTGLGSATGTPSGIGNDPGSDPGNGKGGIGGSPTNPGGSGPTTAAATGAALLLQQLMESSWVQEMHDVYVDSVRYLTPLRMLMQAQAEIPGRKVVLLFSAGLPMHSGTNELLRNVISTANRANVSIYAVDTRGITEESDLDAGRRLLNASVDSSLRQQLDRLNGGEGWVTPLEAISGDIGEDSIYADMNGNMYDLAKSTGGVLLPASLDMRDPLRRAMEEVRTHYELTYAPTEATMNGKFRKIEVRVTRPGAKVFARSGYYALPLLDGHQIYPFEMATLKAMHTTPAPHQFDFHSEVLQFRPGPAQTQMAFVFELPNKNLTVKREGQWNKVHVSITALIKNNQGQVVQKISKDIPYDLPQEKADELQRGAVSFTAPFLLPPGHYTLETAAIDRQSMRASVSRSPLEVAEDSGLSMSDVTVARRIDVIPGGGSEFDPLQARGGKVTPELSDIVPPPDGKVSLYAIAYPPAPIDAPVDASVEITRNGKLLIKSQASEVPPDANGAASILAKLSTERLPIGQYQARVSFQYKGQIVTKTVSFNLKPSAAPFVIAVP
jgi:VWFA-related protein